MAQEMNKKMAIAVGAMLSVAFMSSHAASAAAQSCTEAHCSAGDKAVTFGPKSDPFMMCPTRGLSDYMTFEYGMLALSATLTGKMPNISDKTGDIDYQDGTDGPNKTRLMQDYYRGHSGAQTFDEAMAMCANGKGGRVVTIMNWPDADSLSMSVWVRDERAKISYWVPKSALNKR